uniref:Reeler domain containing 1 n=1 Tax=Takifugu rubripes TaxID=31033 RepID=A0A3B5K0D7_TAKRU
MQPTHHCFLAGAVFLSLVSSTLTFSRGASYASCQDMTPGHISAHPLDPKQNHITLRTSASSYLPGQLLTVTVRSSQDFMGFLLQSARIGPILIGGSWILAPPGTQKLHCVSDDDTLTHSDKQLKRNLSFVWKAPDSPMGDFSITVVQSYFVHWAGIESPVVHDQSRGSVSGSNITSMDEWKLASLLQEEEVAPLPDPPHLPFLQTSSSSLIPISSFKPPLGSSHDLSSVELRTTSPSSPTSQYITSSSFWTVSLATISPTPSSSGTNDSFISSASSATALLQSSSSITTSTSTPVFSVDSISTTSLVMSSGSTSPQPAPSQVHRRSLSQPFTSTYSSVSSQQLPKDQGLLIQIPTAPSESHQKLSIPSPTMMVHPNPEPYPNFDPHLKANINKIEPNPPNTDTKTEHPTNYPDTIPRHTSWELGMLLGCSAGLGMVLVVGLRYMYSQVCGKRTVVTLNNREREYPQGERGLIHVQECGDLVRVRRIRDNSFVFLAEYDILASPED